MPYAILRFQKKKSGGVTASYAHNERKKEAYKSNPDIDTSRKEENYHLVLPKQTYLREAKRMIAAAGCRTRKDSGLPEAEMRQRLPEMRFPHGIDFCWEIGGTEYTVISHFNQSAGDDVFRKIQGLLEEDIAR